MSNQKQKKSLQSREEDWEFTASFLLMLSSPGTLILAWVGFPLLMSEYSEKLAIPAMAGGLILWAIALIWAVSQQERYL